MTNSLTAPDGATLDVPALLGKITTLRRVPAIPPHAERILTEYRAAKRLMETTVERALIVGQLLLEERDAIEGARSHDWAKSEDSKFGVWLGRWCAEIPLRTAYRWMELAEKVALHSGLKRGDGGTALSMALTAPEAELPAQAREWRQTVFAFIANKTMRECLAGVVVEGDEPHRITRAFNGKYAKGAGGGGNRKNFVAFTAQKLRHITTFLGHKLTPVEQGKITASFDAAMQHWPRWAVERMAEIAKRELKLSEEERAGRGQ